jgi:hypothetical protein
VPFGTATNFERENDGLGQLAAEYQATSGSVNASTTPKVQYAYSGMAGAEKTGSEAGQVTSDTRASDPVSGRRIVSLLFRRQLDSAPRLISDPRRRHHAQGEWPPPRQLVFSDRV